MAKKVYNTQKRLKKNINNSNRLPRRYSGVDVTGEPYGESVFLNPFEKDPRVNYMHPIGMGSIADTKSELAESIQTRNPEKAQRLNREAGEINKKISLRPRMGSKFVDVDAISYCGGGRLKRRKKAFGGGISSPGSVGVKDNKFVQGYEVGTPLKEIYNIPKDMPEQAKLMSLQGTKDAMNRTRWANFQGQVTDYPEGRAVPSFRYTPGILEKMKEKGLTRDYIESWQPSNYPEEYEMGGVLSQAIIGAGAGALGGAAVGGIGAIPGAVIGGMSALFKGLAEQDKEEEAKAEAEEVAEDKPIPAGLSRQYYQRAAMGGKLTKFTGPRHEQGGIALGALPVEVEGGETRTGNMIHSDRPENKVTSAMIKKYPVLKKSDKGKTMAQVTERAHKKFEKRQWDEMNDNAAELTMMPYEQISDELSGKTDPLYAADGGDISAAKARMILSHGSIRGKPITDKQRRFFGAKTKAAEGLNLESIGEYGPLIMSGIDTIGALASGPEEVDYGQIGYAPTKVTHLSAEPGIKRVRRGFANAEAKLRRYNPNRYMARMGDLAAREADAVTDVAGGVQAENVRATNKANIVDSTQAMRTRMFNKQVAMSEAQANAQNRAANQSRISANLANMGTISGQMSRDEKLYAAQEESRDRYFDVLDEQNRILGGYGDSTSDISREDQLVLPPVYGYNPDAIPDFAAEEYLYGNTMPVRNPYNYSFANGGSLTHRLRLRNFKTAS